jgi:hypothetical protein
MKKYLIAIIVSSIWGNVSAQCSQQFYFQKGRVVKLATYKTSGSNEPNGEMIYTVQNVDNAAAITKANVKSEFHNKKGKMVSESDALYTCHADTVKADMKTYIPSASLESMKNGASSTFDGTSLAYPPHLNESQGLPDGYFKATSEMEMIKQTVEVKITDRKVVGRETITEAGKKWDCYKITYTCTISIKMMISAKPMVRTMNTTEWYCPSFGVLKTDSGDMGKTEVTYISN